ncbi:MAG: PrsW family intramembrane metalloprotease [Chitinophagales bacterium]|nr:PrsW family intramembrane metalloprotease [Chitinophagales bacterium]
MVQLLLLALAPVVAVVCYIYSRDKYEKEPFINLFISFLLGMFSAFLPLLAGEANEKWGIPETGGLLNVAFYAFIVVALTEEAGKFLFLRYYMYPKAEFDEPFDGIVYGVMVSMGFAALENVLYVLQGGIGIGIVRMFTAIPAHAVFGIIMGYYVGLAKHAAPVDRFRYLLLGLLSATILHGLYDFFIMQEASEILALFSLLLLPIGIRYAFVAMKHSHRLSPHQAVIETPPVKDPTLPRPTNNQDPFNS